MKGSLNVTILSTVERYATFVTYRVEATIYKATLLQVSWIKGRVSYCMQRNLITTNEHGRGFDWGIILDAEGFQA